MNDYQKSRLNFINSGRPLKKKVPVPIKKISDKRAAKLKEEEKEIKSAKQSMDGWFSEIVHKHILNGRLTCMECGTTVSIEWSKKDFGRRVVAHLLPKKLFPSVATHPLNYLILAPDCGCHQKTDRVDKLIKMKVWPEAKRRLRILIPLLPFDELKYISSQLDTALQNA